MPRPFVVRVGDLLRDPGSRRDLDLRGGAGELQTSGARVPAGADVSLVGLVESVPGGVVVTGRVGVPWSGDCRRCLDPTGGVLDIEIREVFQPAPLDDDDVLPLDDPELLDLEPLVREVVLADLPLAPLCGPDCEGPDPERFPTGPPEDADEKPLDPRWGALSELTFDDDA